MSKVSKMILNLDLLKVTKMTLNYDLSKVSKLSSLRINFKRAAIEEAIMVEHQKTNSYKKNIFLFKKRSTSGYKSMSKNPQKRRSLNQ